MLKNYIYFYQTAPKSSGKNKELNKKEVTNCWERKSKVGKLNFEAVSVSFKCHPSIPPPLYLLLLVQGHLEREAIPVRYHSLNN